MADLSLPLLEELFERAAALNPAERRAFLDAECRGEPRLRASVDALLSNDALLGHGDDFLGGPVGEVRAAAVGNEHPIQIAGYRIHRKLGMGGMGSVYEAEQENPRRRAAIKVIRPEMASRESVKRFLVEAQVLGRLRHPGIAQIYEAGLTEDRQPFIAMEYVRGETLLEYAGKFGLEVGARIDVVARVCDAVQHAHSQGVIHRDLKPANILVDEGGQPRVLDFGVARAADVDLQTTAPHTQAGQLIGTLAYMSPEQLAADPAAIDHRADVYALGVILFELLAERLPFDLQKLPLPEVARMICEREAPALGSINRAFRGDLETIVAKALEKNPNQRYRSAVELGDDLRRYQAGEPIQARPISHVDRLARWSRIHQGLTASLGVILALVVAVTIGSTVAAIWFQDIARQNEQARANAEKAGAGERWERYRANIAAAASALQMQNVRAARVALEAAPVEHRNWEWQHFHSQLDTSHLVLDAPVPLRTAILTADGARAVAGADKVPAVFVWNATTGQLLYAITGGADAVQSALRPDGGHAAFGTSDGIVRIFDLATGKETAAFKAHAGSVSALAYSPDGTHLASAGADRAVHLWDLTRAKNPVSLLNLESPVKRLVVAADCKRLLTVTSVNRLWDLETRQALATLGKEPCIGVPIGFRPDGRHAFSCEPYPDCNFRIFDAVNGKALADLRGHQNTVHCVASSPDGSRLVSASQDQTVRLWDGHTFRPIAVLRGHTGWVVDVAFSPDGKRVVSGSNDGSLRIWDADNGELIDVLCGHTDFVNGVAWSADGRQIASASTDRTLRLWHAPGAAGRGILRGHRSFVYDVACRPDGEQLASAGWDGTVRLWNLRTGKETTHLEHDNQVVTSVAYAPNGQHLASVTRGDRVVLWDLTTGKPRHHQAMTGDHCRAEFNPHGTRLAVGTFDGFICLWDVQTGGSASAWAAGARILRDLAFYPDGALLTCASIDGDISLWHVERKERIAVLRGHQASVHRVKFSKDGRLLASASEDRTARLWNASTGQELLPSLVHATEVWDVAFSHDGTRLATACNDNTIRLWDVATGQEVAELRGHQSYVKSVAFSPDGTQLFSGSGDFTVRIWDSVPVRTRAKSAPKVSIH